jgi:hypothetical protein
MENENTYTKPQGILVNPHDKTVARVNLDDLNLKTLYKLLDVDIIDIVGLGDTFCMVVDDEGLLDESGAQRYFTMHGDLYAGNALIIGTNDEGDLCSLSELSGLAMNHATHNITFVGDAGGAEGAIEEGAVRRPMSTFQAGDDPPQVLWEWNR